jgi:DNA mismatch repair protein MutS2
VNKHLDTLELPKILERLAHYAAFSASKELALALRPSPFLAEVQVRQAETGEAWRLLAAKPNLGLGQAEDLRPLTERARRGHVLTPDDLLKIRQTLLVARDLQRTITRMADLYPHLADIAGRIEPCPEVVEAIVAAIDERGEVKNSASPALARIRRDLEVAHSRLMDKLNRLISSTQQSQYLQETLITQRGGRYVVPLKAEFKGRIQGIVHDQSASGATLFIEPLSTVELNNRWRKLQLDEADEINRILAELSTQVGRQKRYIDHTVEALADLDLALAKAKYAEAIDATEPVLYSLAEDPLPESGPPKPDEKAADGPGPPGPPARPLFFSLKAARHPLLDPKTVVPINVWLPEETRMLVITGPNTGGKTVSLKTIGLLAAMAQAGLWIPAAEGSTLPVFNRILADIGDEQSIEQSLSTFSGHMTNIVQILEQCNERSLVIFDELGAGTDPIEGSALARAILSNLLARRVTTFVATHFSELKAYAHTMSGVANASMEFDLDSLAPTFRLRIGLPGASNAFAIARRLGLSETLIDEAQGLVGEEARQIEAMLAEIKAEVTAAQDVRRQAEAERDRAKQLNRERERRLADVDAERRDILNSARDDARREIKAARTEIRTLKAQAEAALQAARESARQASLKAKKTEADEETTPDELDKAEAGLDALAAGLVEELAPPPPPEPGEAELKGPIRPGDKVFVAQFGTVGDVVEVKNGQVEVQLGHFRATAPLADVQLRVKAQTAEPERQANVSAPAPESPGMELDLRGQISEEALLHLDQYLDQAFLAQLPWVRIIHGKGSGTLRQAVRQALQGHPLIASYRPGEQGEGGEGVTVAKLALS